MQVGRDPIGPVCLDRAQCVDDLADRYVPVDRAHPALFERRGEPIDMDCPQGADASPVDRKSVVQGKSWSGRVDLGGGRPYKKKSNQTQESRRMDKEEEE